MNQLEQIKQTFNQIGGKFISEPGYIAEKLKGIKAFVFDWDGVFNNGTKDQNGTSIFSETDSMGTNLLRFSKFLSQGQMPYTAIISGENNSSAFSFTRRERFNTCYFKVANKLEALDHFCQLFDLKPEEIAYFFDYIPDLAVAQRVKIRIFIQRKANPLLNQFVIKQNYTDYITGSESGNFAVREACELLMGLMGNYDQVVSARINFSDLYRKYFVLRQEGKTRFYTSENGIISEQNN